MRTRNDFIATIYGTRNKEQVNREQGTRNKE